MISNARVKTLLLDDARILDAELDKLGPLGGLAVGDRGRVAEGSASTHFDFVVRLSEGVGDARRRLVTASEEWNCDDEPELDVPTKATWKIAEGKSLGLVDLFAKRQLRPTFAFASTNRW